MADNIYIVENSATKAGAVLVDTGGTDWLVMRDVHVEGSTLDLTWSFANGQVTSARGQYFDGAGFALVVEGVIENARGSAGVDAIEGNIFANILYGDPTKTGPGGADTIFGDDGNDTIFGGGGGDTINGAEDNDWIFGGAGADNIAGASGRDTVEGGTGADILSGGAEAGDTLSYRGSAIGVFVDITYGSTTVGEKGDAEGDQINGFRNVLGSDEGDRIKDTVEGTIAFGYNANRFEGRGGYDTLTLGGGNDRAFGGTESDTLYGGLGTDRLLGDDGNDWVWGGEGADTVWGGDGYDYVIGGEGADLVYGGANFDRLYGEEGSDTLVAGVGNDLLFAGSGNDRLDGGEGNDTLVGGDGADLLRGGAGADDFRFLAKTEGGDRVSDMTAQDSVKLQFVHVPTIHWDLSGGLEAGGARLVDTGPNIVLRVNLDADATIEFTVTFVGAASVSRDQIDL